MHQNANEIAGQMCRFARTCATRIVLLHLAYVALGLIIFAPALGLFGRMVLFVSGKTMLADMDIVFFLLSPYGMAAALIFGAFFVTIVIFEQASMIMLLAAAVAGANCTPLQALWYTAARALRLFSFSAQLVVRVVLICLPFIAAAVVIAWLLLSDYDINYYLSHKPPAFLFATVLIVILLLAMAGILVSKLVDWMFSLILLLFKDVTPGSAFCGSTKLTRGRKPKMLALLVTWGISTMLLGVLLLSLIQVIGTQMAPMFVNSVTLLAIQLGALAIIFSLANFFVTALNAGSFAGLLVITYTHFQGKTGLLFDDRHEYDFRLGTLWFTLLLASMVLGSVASGYLLIDDIQAVDETLVVAHRGAAGKAPENTMAAIKTAIKDGADWVEIDVQETIDGEVVIFHDSDFMKLAGKDIKVWEARLGQLQEIDIGSWFAPEFAGERVPTLREVLLEVKGMGKVMIELKYYGHDQQLEQRVIDLVEETDMAENTVIMSLKYQGIQKVSELRPAWPVGLLSAQTIGDTTRLNVSFLAVNRNMATPLFIRKAQAAGKKVFVWTVNDQMSMNRMMSLGVDGIITDEPEMARNLIMERAEMNSVERLLLHAAVLLGQTLPTKKYRDESP